MRKIMKLEYDELTFEKAVDGSTVAVITVEGNEFDAFTMGVERDSSSWADFVLVCDRYVANWIKSNSDEGGESK